MGEQGFGAWLRRARGDRPRRVIDDALGRRSWTNHVESGRMKPPARPDCDRLDRILGLPPGTVWQRSAPARLQWMDPELYEWHLERAAGTPPPAKDLADACAEVIDFIGDDEAKDLLDALAGVLRRELLTRTPADASPVVTAYGRKLPSPPSDGDLSRAADALRAVGVSVRAEEPAFTAPRSQLLTLLFRRWGGSTVGVGLLSALVEATLHATIWEDRFRSARIALLLKERQSGETVAPEGTAEPGQ